MEIINKKITELKPYENNPRLNDDAVPYVANSIKEFGFKVPIVIDKNNVIITGHTRLKAAKELGMKEVPCIIADDLTDKQVKAFRLADNKVSEMADWDFDLLDEEINDILELDMGDFGFDFLTEEEQDFYEEQTQDRVENILNLGKAQYEGVGKYDIPQLDPVYELPEIEEWIGFNYVLSDTDPYGKGVHFFLDDYQFERVWNNPEAYVDKLRQYAAVATPDFSPYADMPMATQIFNHYRKHWVGRFWQNAGVIVIPTIRASVDPRSLEWFLDGEPRGGIVMFSSMWSKQGTLLADTDEYRIMCEAIKPKKVFCYGTNADATWRDTEIEYIQTFTRKRFNQ